jgi:mono/diheme cytochrome c family protein
MDRSNIKRVSRCCVAAILIILSAVIVWQTTDVAQAADADNGQRLAQRWCAACDVIAAGQRRANADAPSFPAIANRPGLNALEIALFLLNPHPQMPDMGLSRAAAADLAAYIKKQR